MSRIKFVFFDLGNVLLHFDHDRLIQQVADLSDRSRDDVRQLLFQSPHNLENRFERGELNSDEFHEKFCTLADCKVARDELMLVISDIFWLNTSIVPVVSQLRAINFPMAILSNTCEAHWTFACQRFAAVGQLFDRRVLSYEEKSMKPDRKIYQAATELASKLVNCDAEEIFFTDDKQENIDAARDSGINAQLFKGSRELMRALQSGGVFDSV